MRRVTLVTLGMLLSLAALPAPGRAAPVVPPGADPEATLFIGPAGAGRAGIFGREVGAGNRFGPWVLLATDADAPYEFALTEVRDVDGRTSLGVRPAQEGTKIEAVCPGKKHWETNEDTGEQSIEFQNVNNPGEHTGFDFRFKFRELYCEGGTAGFVDSWFRTSDPTQEVFVKAYILNQDKNADTAIPFEWYVKGRAREGTPQMWRRTPEWGLPYWFKALFKSVWQAYDSGQPNHTAIDNKQWPKGDGLFSVGYHCPEYGPDPVPACYDLRSRR